MINSCCCREFINSGAWTLSPDYGPNKPVIIFIDYTDSEWMGACFVTNPSGVFICDRKSIPRVDNDKLCYIAFRSISVSFYAV